MARIDRQVKIRGFRVELEEVERAILAAGMARAAVVEKAATEPPRLICVFIPAAAAPRPEASPMLRETTPDAELTDDFHLVGGHSLLIVRVVRRLRKEYRIILDFRQFAINSSIEAIIQACRRAGDTSGG